MAANTDQDVIRLLVLITLAHIFGGDDSPESPCQQLLARYNVSSMVIQMLDATRAGDGLYLDIPFSTEEVLSSVTSLSRSPESAARLVMGGVLPMLLDIIQDR